MQATSCFKRAMAVAQLVTDNDAVTRKTEKREGRLVIRTQSDEGTVTSFDGTEIAYQRVGRIEPTLVCCNGLGVGSFFWIYLKKYFKGKASVVTWDYRGHGRSSLLNDPNHYTLDAVVKDLKVVLDELGVKKTILLGHSLGSQVILEFYRRYSNRVAALIPCLGTDGHPMNTFYNSKMSRYLFQVCYELGQRFPTPSNFISHLLLRNPLSFYLGGLLKIMHTGMVNKKDIDRYIHHILKVNPIFFTRLLKSAQEHTAEDLLPDVKVPTLIIAGEEDQFTPLWISKKMHRLVPNSELMVIKKGTHAALVEQPELINLRVEKFVRERIKSNF